MRDPLGDGANLPADVAWARNVVQRRGRGLAWLVGFAVFPMVAMFTLAVVGVELHLQNIGPLFPLVLAASAVGAVLAFRATPKGVEMDMARAVLERELARLRIDGARSPEEDAIASLFAGLRARVRDPAVLAAIDDAERRSAALRADVSRLEEALRTEAALGSAPPERLERLTAERDARKALLDRLLGQLRALHVEVVLAAPAPEAAPVLIERLTATLVAENEVERATAARASTRTLA